MAGPWLALVAGHLVAVALVAAAAVAGLSPDRPALQGLACVLLVAAVTVAVRGRVPTKARAAKHAGLGLWSFVAATSHGAGLALVPALMPLCAGKGSMLEGPLLPALAAAGIHMAVMVAVSGGAVLLACRGWRFVLGLQRAANPVERQQAEHVADGHARLARFDAGDRLDVNTETRRGGRLAFAGPGAGQPGGRAELLDRLQSPAGDVRRDALALGHRARPA